MARRFLAILTVVVVGVAAPVTPGAAFPPQALTSGSCGTSFLDWTEQGDGWTSALRSAVDRGLRSWFTIRDFDGTTVLTEAIINPIPVRLVSAPGGKTSNLGYANCTNRRIELRSNLTATQIEAVMRHEVGHFVGLHHTGTTDSYNSVKPAMSTCLGPTTGADRNVSQDDSGSVMHKRSAHPKGLMANPGFEQGSSYWGFSGSSSQIVSTSNSQAGSAHLRYTPSSSGSNVFQTMNFAAGSGRSVRARINARRISTTAATGQIRFAIYALRVDYAAANDCTYQTGRDQNQRLNQGSYIWVIKTDSYHTPSTSWATVTSSQQYQIPSYHAVDLRLRVFSNVRSQSTGAFMQVGLDSMRILEI